MPYSPSFLNNMNLQQAKCRQIAREGLSLGQIKKDVRTARFLALNEGGLGHYAFVLSCYDELKTSFADLEAVLSLEDAKQTQQDEEQALQRKAMWFHCYMMCRLLIEFYRERKNSGKVQEYVGKAKEIAAIVDGTPKPKKKKIDIREKIRHFARNLLDDLLLLFKTLFNPTLLRDKVGLLNIFRVYWIFCRLMFTFGLRLFRKSHIIEKFERLTKKLFDEEAFIKKIQAPNVVFNILSVAFFAIRFFIHFGIALQYIVNPPKDHGTSFKERLMHEAKKRHPTMLNDVAWALVNLFTNYPNLVHVSGALANYLTAGFLFFDACMILWQWQLALWEFEKQEAIYNQTINEFKTISRLESLNLTGEQKTPLDNLYNRYPGMDDPKTRQLWLEIEKKKLRELYLNWKAKRAAFFFYAMAASFLMVGFTLPLVLSLPFIGVFSYALCMIGAALYLSGKDFGTFRNKAVHLEELKKQLASETVDDKKEVGRALVTQARLDYREARSAFIYTLAKNVIVPTLIVGAFAAGWQVLLPVLALYLVVELALYYRRNNEKSPAKLTFFKDKNAEDGVVEVPDPSPLPP